MKFPIQKFYSRFSIFTFLSVVPRFLIKYMKYEKCVRLLNKFSNLILNKILKNRVLCAKILSSTSLPQILAIFSRFLKRNTIRNNFILHFNFQIKNHSFFEEKIFTFCELSTYYIFCEKVLQNLIFEIPKKILFYISLFLTRKPSLFLKKKTL